MSQGIEWLGLDHPLADGLIEEASDGSETVSFL